MDFGRMVSFFKTTFWYNWLIFQRTHSKHEYGTEMRFFKSFTMVKGQISSG